MATAKNDIKAFIDFFHDGCARIRKEKAVFERGKDGNLIKTALKKFSRRHLEMLAVWFLAKKPKLRPRIGTMLSKNIMDELERKMKSPDFWKDIDAIFKKYYPRMVL